MSLINVEALIPAGHPIRAIKRLCDEALRTMSAHFDEIYAQAGAPSIPPETLLLGKGRPRLAGRSRRGQVRPKPTAGSIRGDR